MSTTIFGRESKSTIAEVYPVTIFTPRYLGLWPARPGMILAPSRSHDPVGVVTGPGGWLVIADRGLAGISRRRP